MPDCRDDNTGILIKNFIIFVKKKTIWEIL